MPKISAEQKDEVRQRILDIAKSIFIEKGYEATTMKEIVERSGRSFGGVYLYYANKEDVFIALLREQFNQMGSHLTGDSEPIKSVWEKLNNFLNNQLERVADVEQSLAPSMYEYFIVGRKQAEIKQKSQLRYDAMYSHLKLLILEGVMQKQFAPSQPIEAIVHFIISSLDGLFIESIIGGSNNIMAHQQMELLRSFCITALNPIDVRSVNER